MKEKTEDSKVQGDDTGINNRRGQRNILKLKKIMIIILHNVSIVNLFHIQSTEHLMSLIHSSIKLYVSF